MNIKEQWDKVWDQADVTAKEINNYLQSGIPSIATAKMSKLEKEFSVLINLMNGFDKNINRPIKPIKINIPFDDTNFPDLWQYWKDYLLESKNITYQSRQEQMALNYLYEISDHKADLAGKYLKYAMATGYKNFFKISEKTMSKPAKINFNKNGDFENE